MALWAGRFKKELNETVNAFNSSISFDCRMYAQDIKGSLAHAQMLARQGIIEQEAFLEIQQGLQAILKELEEGTLPFDEEAEDIHMFIEAELTKRYPISGKKLHTARSRNDQVALDVRMYTQDACVMIKEHLVKLIHVLCEISNAHTSTIMSGYTHLQRAQPITFAHHLMAYTEMFLRDLERLEEVSLRILRMPLGSGALASTTYPIDREFVCEKLNFLAITQNSLDGVSDRDYAIEFTNILATIMMHLSRFSEEIILWCSWEFKYIELDDAYATGSSIMPQKKNPDIAELVRGKSARVMADANQLLVMMKGLPLAYNKDMQEDKEALFDAIDNTELCLNVFTDMIKTMKVNKETMRNAAAKGFINATDCADYLVRKGLPFRDAYKVVGELVAYAIDHDQTLEGLTLEEYQKMNACFDESIYEAINLENCVQARNVIGGPSPEAVKKRIEEVQAFLKEEYDHA